MSMSKDKKARRELALKRARQKRLLVIIACILAAVGIVVAMAFLVDWENFSNPPASNHTHGDSCNHG